MGAALVAGFVLGKFKRKTDLDFYINTFNEHQKQLRSIKDSLDLYKRLLRQTRWFSFALVMVLMGNLFLKLFLGYLRFIGEFTLTKAFN